MDSTIKFVVPDNRDEQAKVILKSVYASLSEKGYTRSTRSSVIC